MSYMEINKQSDTIYPSEGGKKGGGAGAERVAGAAVICEYNPFHNGHRRHIELTRSLYGAENIIAIMSGSFVQRGDCAVYPKQVRARAALLGGADIVFELPLPWCMSTAERFAFGGVSLADAAGCSDMLSFGSECGDIAALTAAADILGRGEVYERSRELQKSGMTFAAARSAAASELAGGGGYDLAAILSSPNDILGVEYIRALKTLGSPIRPVCVGRTGDAHDSAVSYPGKDGGGDLPDGGIYPSASRLREQILSGGACLPGSFEKGVPAEAIELYRNSPVTRLGKLDRLILAKLRLMSEERIAALPDVSEGLEHRIYREAGRAESYEGLCAAVKCKRYTLSRIRRILLCALLGIPAGYSGQRPPYLRLLGMNRKGERLLRDMKPAVPVVAALSDSAALGGFAREIFELNARACEIYAMCAEPPLPRGCDHSGGVIYIRD